ncbi:hypothetical protein POM88_023756 [Heracleum sosnowskyi]|uniref:HSF-type DNA-binding domain-containing protein n=1 Tax=Heracleum sosnowskyi TaxID=360622 RepID=A0AAD8IJH1_9APIA|nr:hypothetical protein POM88_023756 [Heracleum sosnowskyi]
MREDYSHRAKPAPFLAKIYEIIDNPDNEDLVSWNANGSSFIVKDATVFARDLLPKHFKHNTFASFVRQLNNYGFSKLSTNFQEWEHEKFKRGEKHRLVEIQSKRLSSGLSVVQAATSANTRDDHSISPPRNAPLDAKSDPEIVRENKRLKKATLRQEFRKLRCMVQNIASMIEDLSDDEPASEIPVESSGTGDAQESASAHMEIDLNHA